MQEDLFGQKFDNRDSYEKELEEFDKATFPERLKRFRYFYKYYPNQENILFGSDESYRIFKEVQSCYINAEYIATIVLVQSFIERRFQESLFIRGFEKESKYTLHNILKEFKGKNIIPDYFINKVDSLRVKRNPLIHFRNINDMNNLFSRSFRENKKAYYLLENDAKGAISIMFESLKISVL